MPGIKPGSGVRALLAPFCAPFCSFCSPALPCPGHCSFQRLRAWELEVIALGSSAFSQGWEALMRGGGEVGGVLPVALLREEKVPRVVVVTGRLSGLGGRGAGV